MKVHRRDATTNGGGRGPTAMRLFALAAALQGVLSSGCVAAVAPPRCPSHGGNRWYELTTKHFVLRTDMAEDKAREAALEAERGYSELVAAGFPQGAGVAERLPIVMVRDHTEMAAYWPEHAGFSAERLSGDLEHAPTLVLSGAQYTMYETYTRSTFLHELTHRFLAYTYGDIPIWLNEGLAQYYSTLRVEEGKLVLGDVTAGTTIPAASAPSVKQLLTIDRSTFYAEREPIFFRRADTRYLYYKSAWALVHYLQNGPDERRARFRSFIRASAAGAPAATAWATTVGQVPLETLEREYRAYLTAWSWDRFVYPLPKLDVAPVESVRALSDAETAILWARLLGGKQETKALAAAALQEAIAHEPSSPEVAYWAGSDALLRSRPHEARVHFERALARDPNEPRALYGFVRATVEEAKGRPLSNEAGAATLDALTRLEKSAKTADQLDLVARVLASEPTLDAALRAAERAVVLDPGYFDARATRAHVHFARGEGAKAVADQERAIALLPEGVDAQKYLARLESYRAASTPKHVSAGP